MEGIPGLVSRIPNCGAYPCPLCIRLSLGERLRVPRLARPTVPYPGMPHGWTSQPCHRCTAGG